MSVSINGTTGLVFNDGSTQTTSPFTGGFGFRNRIINGNMVIDQRNAGASVTPASGAYLVDRFWFGSSQASKFTAQQVSTAPTGFINSLKMTVSSSVSIGSSDFFFISQRIEGLNVSDLAWGTASAQTVTLSFEVYSSLTGTFGGALKNSDASRCYPFSYTVSSANTWTKISVTIAGDTSGTWLTNNGTGIRIDWGLGVGSTFSGTAGSWSSSNLISATGATSVVGTSGATFYITGVQFEKGSTATSFDYRPYGTELALCQRYYVKLGSDGAAFASWGNGIANTSSTLQGCVVRLPVSMRTQPTMDFLSVRAYDGANAAAISSVSGVSSVSSANALGFDATCSSSVLTAVRPVVIQGNNSTSAYIAAIAEL
jgi:hypothetical protein